MISLERRIRISLLIMLLLVMSLLLLLVNRGVEQLTKSYVTAGLQEDADSIIAALQLDKTGQLQLDNSKLHPSYQRVYSGHYYAIQTNQQLLRSRSLWDRDLPLQKQPPGSLWVTMQNGIAEQQWLTLSQGVLKDDIPVTIWVADDITPFVDQINRFTLYVLGMVVFAVIVILALQRLILHRGFKRLEPVRCAIEQCRQDELESMNDDIPLEIQPLVKEIQRLLARFTQRVQRSRTALGNLTHELKRPLLQIDLIEKELPEGKNQQQIHQAVQSIHNLINRELKRARIAGTSMPGQHFEPRDDLPHLAEILSRLYRDGIQLKMSIPERSMPFDRDDMLELIGNLLDNAFQHASTRVQLSIQSINSNWQIRVDDDGPGVVEEDLQKLQQRGVRIDEQHAGHGLGLAICSDVVQGYNGTLNFSLSEMGGLSVTIELPLTNNQ